MAEIQDKCTFECGADQIRMTTQANGDIIHIKKVHLTGDDAAALAYLINSKVSIKVVLKEA